MRFLVLTFLLTLSLTGFAQDDLLDKLSGDHPSEDDFTIATFKGTRIVNGHSIETKPAGALEFIISHRFGTLNSGSYELWGLDNSVIRLGLEYGITDRLGIGIGRGSEYKIYDGYLKYKAFRQGGTKNVPVTVTALGSIAYRGYKEPVGPQLSGNDKMSMTGQLLIARKFSPALSLQVMPTLLHRNTVDQDFEVNDLAALGVAGRIKVTRSFAINLEYYYRLNEHKENPYHDPLGINFEIETGGHVFQLIFTNTTGMTERAFLPETFGDFFDGDIHFGFNITRTFQLAGKK